MKKITLMLLGLVLSAGVANAAAPVYQPIMRSATPYVVPQSNNYISAAQAARNNFKEVWYMTLRAELSLLNWKNTYFSDYVGYEGGDSYSFRPLLGGSIAVGKNFNHFWRGEIEAGYTGVFTDRQDGFDFTFSTPYMLANAIYDWQNGWYAGGGLGLAVPIITMDSEIFLPGSRVKYGISPMAGLMFGWTRKLDDKLVLDLRYRIAGFNGTTQTRKFEDKVVPPNQYYLDTKIGLVLDNSFSVGLRYEF